MHRVLALVEGQTEETFIGRILGPHLQAYGVALIPTVIVTKRVLSGPDKKGGVGSWSQVKGELDRLVADTAAAAITTMIDLYGLPADTPGIDEELTGGVSRAESVANEMRREFADSRFRAFISAHEFEALLFSDPAVCGSYLGSDRLVNVMADAISSCGSPEEVNNDPATAPSKRIAAAFPQYQKVLHGSALAERISLPEIRRSCPHFSSWVEWLESLG